MHFSVPALLLAVGMFVVGCATESKKEEEPSKDTFECTLLGDRYVVRFTDGEARILLPDASRLVLYQIPAASGVRYTNGLNELRGKGMQLQLVADGVARSLEGCKPVMVPKQEPTFFDKLMPAPK